jgi:membrane-associated phospholipid phosphatase
MPQASVLRPEEIIIAAALLWFVVLGLVRPIGRDRRRQVITLGVAGFVLILLGQVLSLRLPETARVVRDWGPAITILLVYWQSGRFFVSPNQKLQSWLERSDQRQLGPLLGRWEREWGATLIGNYLELAYSLCYALIPLGVGVLYWEHRRAYVDWYWIMVLPSTLLCYAVIPFAPTIPPRLVKVCTECPKPALRSMNWFILRHASIQLNTCPSAHVASTMAASLALLYVAPVAGAIFLVVSISIAAGAVLGRYHYLADVVLGALLALGTLLLALGLGAAGNAGNLPSRFRVSSFEFPARDEPGLFAARKLRCPAQELSS